MSEQSTLTVHLSGETNARLERLAIRTSRTRSALASEALAHYVDRELAVIEAIERGREEVRKGGGLDTEGVFRDVEAAIVAKEAGRTGP